MNIEGIPLVLNNYNIEVTPINSYLFIMFFLQRCQLIANIIRIFLPECKDCMKYGIKYCILESNFGDLLRKIREFKQEFQQDEIISEIMTFIRASIDKKPNYRKIEYDLNELRIQNYIMNFTTINDMIKEIDKNFIKDEDISSFKNQFYNYVGVKNMEKELIKLDVNWIIYKDSSSKQNEELYNFMQKWFIL
jgi:hypothetical protein